MDKKRIYWLIGMVAFSVLLTSFTFYFYQAFFGPNTLVDKEKSYMLKIPKEADFNQVRDSLLYNDVIQDVITFSFVAKVMKYQEKVKPGLFEIPPRLSNRELVGLLRLGKQTPINITFNNVRTQEDLAEKITVKLEMDKEEFLELLKDTGNLEKFGFEPTTIMSMFIPNTYEVYWNITPSALFDRMYQEYNRFWSEERKARAEAIGMSPKEVATLASIVQAETSKRDEQSKVAGVYVNRLNRNMLLQADPTLVYAIGDFGIKRVLNVHKEIDSPYNTYKYPGLPPGPINLPDIPAMEAVLNYQEHNYLYFCAKDDFSGYHAFATNLREHMNNARRYQNALNAAKIYQ
ncbi:endolytic transglycosylase MltG [Pleomorphovibrio marinus]|uniref:endolytic transglycosylase MltG n=1 Tax=Pleomorphovibrio marinus TaxID=2164132 RepID=UPI000E0A82AE|nr:endolytic transglycosylase MltG [Pleomorphovibrio marinus]